MSGKYRDEAPDDHYVTRDFDSGMVGPFSNELVLKIRLRFMRKSWLKSNIRYVFNVMHKKMFNFFNCGK